MGKSNVPDRWDSKPPSGEWQPVPTLGDARVVPEQQIPAPPGVPANWYPDPNSPGVLRYWNGVAWTEHRQAPPPPAGATVINNVNVRGGGGSDTALHLILTLLTCGLWLPIWIVIEIIKAVSR